jgi:Sporulation initiation factor Spo0A C terminal.
MRNIYKKIAKEHGVSVEEVKRDMQAAIDYAYIKKNKLEREKVLQASVPCKDKVPEPEDFIRYVVKRMKSQRS